jgi:hypothetical protein
MLLMREPGIELFPTTSMTAMGRFENPEVIHSDQGPANFCDFFTKSTTPEIQLSDFVNFYAVKRTQEPFLVTICDDIGISFVHVFCTKSVGVKIPNHLSRVHSIYIPMASPMLGS